MWKVVTIELGKETQLDPPNEHAVMRIVPMSWLPGKTNAEIMAFMQASEQKANEAAAAAKAKGESPELAMMNVHMENLKTIIPMFVIDWTLIDPGTGQPFPGPREMQKAGDLSPLEDLPVQLLSKIVDLAMAYDMPDDLAPPPADDPDKGNEAAQVIPFETVKPFEEQSSTVQLIQPPSSTGV